MNLDSARAKLSQIVIDTTNARDAAEFWRELLGLAYRPGHEPPLDAEDDRPADTGSTCSTPTGHRGSRSNRFQT
jgi:hypothetical protein